MVALAAPLIGTSSICASNCFRTNRSRPGELRANITAYDAWYVAVAETFDAELATLDRDARASVCPRCDLATP